MTSFEGEMAAFFERLLSEEDPTRFAAMAETLPEPPSFDNDDVPSSDWSTPVATAEAPVEAPVEPSRNRSRSMSRSRPRRRRPSTTGARRKPRPPTPARPPRTLPPRYTDPPAEATAEASERSGWESETPSPPPTTRAAEAPVAETAVAEATPESTSADTGDLFGVTADEPTADVDPRLSALGMEQDFAAAEAEAGSFSAEVTTDDQEIPTIPEDALAARLAGLVASEEPDAPSEAASTRVVVTGLVSVASIAGFKRNLSRVSGVRSVGVSSGPDGEFVFAVNHDPGLDLTDGIATLPGFSARVTNEALGELTVAARDPESEG